MSDKGEQQDHHVEAQSEHKSAAGSEAQHSSEQEDAYQNNHDLIGIEGIISAQKSEIEKKKVSLAHQNHLTVIYFVHISYPLVYLSLA